MSRVSCHMSRVTCDMSQFFLFIFIFSRTKGEAYQWRVCYQQGLPRLVYPHLALWQTETGWSCTLRVPSTAQLQQVLFGSMGLHLGSMRPHLGSLMPHLGSMGLHLGSMRPHLGSLRPHLGSMKPHLGSMRLSDLGLAWLQSIAIALLLLLLLFLLLCF